MDNLDSVLKAIAADPKRGIFVSRSGAERQRELAIWIASRLKANGYIPILQDAHFKRTNFMLAMDAALASGVRVLALMSREYLKSEHCMKEATSALDDQLNSSGRLVILRIDDCEPLGILRRIDRMDFGRVWRSGNAAEMERVLLAALEAPLGLSGTFYVPTAIDPAQTIHPQVLMHDEAAFTGRERELADLKELLWNGGTAALTRAGAKGLVDEAVLRGMGGVGKTTLARAYAFRHRSEYHAVWWLRAESEETLVEDLIELGARYDPTLARRDDRAAAAREVLALIADPRRKTDRPWLLVYDNAPGPGALVSWRPAANAHAIVTSRNPNWDKAVPLEVFSPETAVALLTETAQRTSDADKVEAAALAEQLGRLPLALAHAASKCRGNKRITFAAYGRRLSEFWRDKPDAAAAHGRYGRSVWATFTIALDDIVAGGPDGDPAACPEAETVIGVLAHLAPEQVPDFLLAPLYDGGGAVMTEATLDRALEELAAAGLVAWSEFEDGAPHLNVHRLVQDITRARLAARGRAAEIATLATRLAESTFDASGSFAAQTRNHRWLPQAVEAARRAPRSGADAWHSLWTQLHIGDLYVMRGSLGHALAAYQDGLALAGDLAKTDPGNAGPQRDLSEAHSKVGDVLVEQGNLPAALEAFLASLAIRERVAKADSANAGRQRDLSEAHRKIGDVLVEQGNLPAALDAFQASLAIRERFAKADPANAGWQRDLSEAYNRIGDVLVEQGNLPAALDAFHADLAIAERLAKADPGNARWQRDLSVTHSRIGDVLVAQGNLPAALEAYQADHAIAERLAKADPGNTGWQRDLSVSHEKIGDVLRALGNLPAALEAYIADLTIAESLAKTDPENAGWQRDLSVSHNNIGEVLRAQGNLPAALDAYHASLAIREHLAKADPSNAEWQRDLSVSHNNIGEVLRDQGNLPAAFNAYHASLAIRERLAKADLSNAGYQHDVALSLQGTAGVAAQQGLRIEGIAAYQRGLDIMRRLTALAPDHAQFKRDLAWFEARIAEISPAGDPPPAKPANGGWLRRWLKR